MSATIPHILWPLSIRPTPTRMRKTTQLLSTHRHLWLRLLPVFAVLPAVLSICPSSRPSLFHSGTSSVTVNRFSGLSITLTATDSDGGEQVDIVALEDPGLPIDARLSSRQCSMQVGCQSASRTLTWSPQPEDQGRTVVVCFVAYDDSDCG